MAEQKLVDAKALSDAFYEADAITMKGVVIINQFPTVEAKPVVHCRDCCCFCYMGSINKYFCEEFGGYVTAKDYCSRYTLKNPNCGAQMDEEED